MPRPTEVDYPEYFENYIIKVPGENLMDAFAIQFPVISDFFSEISEEESMHSYAPGKWTIKEVIQHIIDAERIFAYRAVSIARKESASLPSFEENDYTANSEANRRTWDSLCNEFLHARRSTQDLFQSFTESMLNQKGIANNKEITVLSIGFITVGHLYHHISVLKERYLKR